MPLQADTDKNLAETGRRQRLGALPLLGIGAVALVIGAIFLLIEGQGAFFVGIALVALGSIPFMAGFALFLSGLVSRRASKQKPFA